MANSAMMLASPADDAELESRWTRFGEHLE